MRFLSIQTAAWNSGIQSLSCRRRFNIFVGSAPRGLGGGPKAGGAPCGPRDGGGGPGGGLGSAPSSSGRKYVAEHNLQQLRH